VTRIYTSVFKAQCVKRLEAPDAPSVQELSKELGVSKYSLYTWLRRAREGTHMRDSGKPWSVEDQIRVLKRASELAGEELGGYLREQGVHPDLLEAWREALQGASADRADKRRIKALERELRRKEKALAEAAAILVLQKKVQEGLARLAGEDDDTLRPSES